MYWFLPVFGPVKINLSSWLLLRKLCDLFLITAALLVKSQPLYHQCLHHLMESADQTRLATSLCGNSLVNILPVTVPCITILGKVPYPTQAAPYPTQSAPMYPSQPPAQPPPYSYGM